MSGAQRNATSVVMEIDAIHDIASDKARYCLSLADDAAPYLSTPDERAHYEQLRSELARLQGATP